MWTRHSFAALTVLTFAAGRVAFGGGTDASATADKHCQRWEAISHKLGLTDQQKAELRTIHADFHTKKAPVKQQLHALRQEKRKAMTKVLTEEQRDKVRPIIKAHWDKKWEAAAAKLELTDEQQQRIDTVRATYGKKFRELAEQTDSAPDQFRKLGREKRHAIGRELTAKQRTTFHALVRVEKRQRRNPAARREFWKGVGEKLGVTAEQKAEFKKLAADFAPKLEKSQTQFESLRREQHAAMRKVLTEEQRSKLREMRKARGEEKAADAAEG